MFLFRHIMDRELVDRAGFKAGKVDDIVLQLRPGELPAVRTILTGHGALLPVLPGPIGSLLAWLERHILDAERIEPRSVDWSHVSSIDVVVHLDVEREAAGLMETQHTLWRRFIQPIPGGGE